MKKHFYKLRKLVVVSKGLLWDIFSRLIILLCVEHHRFNGLIFPQ